MQISMTYYLDVISSWCFWAEPSWAELKRRYSDRVAFDWKIALMDPSGLPKSRAQEEWYYRRSGMVMRSNFMLRRDWYESVMPDYLAPCLSTLAARHVDAAGYGVRAEHSTRRSREGAM